MVEELATHALSSRQIADRRRSRQRLNGQVLTVTLRQHRRCANALSHIRTTPENVSVPSSALPASIGLACDPHLNHAGFPVRVDAGLDHVLAVVGTLAVNAAGRGDW